MRRKLLTYITSLAIIMAPLAYAPVTLAQENLSVQGGAEAARGNQQQVDLFGTGGAFGTITNVLLFIIGALAVIMLIIGGLRYVLSGGNAASVTAAKNTILYAIVGIIVALLAYAVINFVINSFAANGTNGL